MLASVAGLAIFQPMNERGELVCGPHGRSYCEECSEAERTRLEDLFEPLGSEPEEAQTNRDAGTKVMREFPSFKRARGAGSIRGSQR